ncbi:MAG: thioesterase family protein [Bacteriovoracaceae bacterium]|nr:thioesterase family protein [Bacteriovoracaceae bacterium]
MARVKIKLPDHSFFKTQVTLRINDINYGGHMGNDTVLSLCHEARIQFLHHFDFDELNIFGKSIIMSDACVVYKKEAFHRDKLEILLFIDDLNDYGFDLLYQINNLKHGQEVARAKTGIVFFDYQKRKISKCPRDFINFVKQKDLL